MVLNIMLMQVVHILSIDKNIFPVIIEVIYCIACMIVVYNVHNISAALAIFLGKCDFWS